jgi:putative ABC transport system substrate-binding protein
VYRRAAGLVDKILKGAKPGDLPVEGPKRVDMGVNLKAAKALGVVIPESMVKEAVLVIE